MLNKPDRSENPTVRNEPGFAAYSGAFVTEMNRTLLSKNNIDQ
ncbi:hypothetical protein [Pedobacter terrae]